MPDETNNGKAVEIQEYLQSQLIRKRLLPRAALVGLAAGSIAVGFRIALAFVDGLRQRAASVGDHEIWGFLVVALIGGVGTYLAMRLAAREPDAAGSGIPQMKAVLEGHLELNWARMVWVKFTGALIALGSGMALGREGPTVQMGGAVGHGVADKTRATPRESKALTAAGAGAGLAAAFNAPLAGVTFVLEELQRDFQPVVFVAALLSAAIATVISRLASGSFPVFNVPAVPSPPLSALPLFVIIGALGGVISAGFNSALLKALNITDSIRHNKGWLVAVIAGLSLGGAFLVSPTLLGGGHELSENAFKGTYTLSFALALLAVRFLLIHVCYGTGVPGGIFAPLLSLGALVGLIVFRSSEGLGMDLGAGTAACAVAGMCAMFSGIVRAPLTGIILIGEMTGSYELLLPLLVTSFTAYLVAEGLKALPIYESLLQRIAEQREFQQTAEERHFVEFEIRPDSPLVGRNLKDAALPAGALVVLCTLAGREIVPRGSTVLAAGMKVAVLATSAKVAHEVELMARG